MFFKNKSYFILIFSYIITTAVGENKCRNNSCKTYLGYFLIDISPNCYCTPDIGKDVDIITKNLIGVNETHEVTTEDGYIIGIFRMPRKNPKGVVILHHPVVVSSRIWVTQGNQSTALWFWEQGYDVWMPNNRGTLYSKKHTTLTSDDSQYWDFSFHEIGYYDHKAAIDYIYNITNQKIIFIGHSMSTTTSLIYSSLRPNEAQEKVKINILIAPVSYLKYITSPSALAAKIMPIIELFNKITNSNSLLALHSWYVNIFRVILLKNPFKIILVSLISAFCGWTPFEFDTDLANLIVLQGISEVSWKTFYHYSQIKNALNGRFQMYDYKKKKNLKKYGQTSPPLYPLENITIPTYIIHSITDTVSQTKDVDTLFNKLPEATKIYGRYELEGMNHVDFHFGKHRRTRIYDPLFSLLSTL